MCSKLCVYICVLYIFFAIIFRYIYMRFIYIHMCLYAFCIYFLQSYFRYIYAFCIYSLQLRISLHWWQFQDEPQISLRAWWDVWWCCWLFMFLSLSYLTYIGRIFGLVTSSTPRRISNTSTRQICILRANWQSIHRKQMFKVHLQ